MSKISQYPQLTVVQSTDEYVVNQGGTTKKGTIDQLTSWMAGAIPPASLTYNGLMATSDKTAILGLQTELQKLDAYTGAVSASSIVSGVFVYDTTKDSDGGAWRKKCTGTSWFNEYLGSGTRGNRQDCPSRILIVTHQNRVAFFDGDMSAPAMWMTFLRGSNTFFGGGINDAYGAISAYNGKIFIACSGIQSLIVIDLLNDVGYRYKSGGVYTTNQRTIAARNTGGTTSVLLDTRSLTNLNVQSVSAYPLPGAELDHNGLPRLTVACGTTAGINVVLPSGNITTSSDTNSYQSLQIMPTGDLVAQRLVSGSSTEIVRFASSTLWTNSFVPKWGPLNQSSTPRIKFMNTGAMFFSPDFWVGGSNSATTTDQGAFFLIPDQVYPSDSMVASIRNDYNTGYLAGDCRMALATFLTTSATGTEPDLSPIGAAVTVNGTVPRSMVNTGTDLCQWGPFTTANYMSQAYSANLDFSTTDFMTYLWVRPGAANEYYVSRAASTMNTGSWAVYLSGGNITFTVTGGTTLTGPTLTQGAYYHVAAGRRNGTWELWVNGRLASSSSTGGTQTLSASDKVLRIGLDPTLTIPCQGYMSLVRISAFAPTKTQLVRMYRDEGLLFNQNAKCLIGTQLTNVINGSTYDAGTNLTFYCTSDGTSVFKDLLRVDHVRFSTWKNLIKYTRLFENAVWTPGTGITVTPNTDVGVEGELTADNHFGTALTAGSTITSQTVQISGSTAGLAYTGRFRIKRAGSGISAVTVRIEEAGGVSPSVGLTGQVWAIFDSNYVDLVLTYQIVQNDRTSLVLKALTGADGDVNMSFADAQLESGYFATSQQQTGGRSDNHFFASSSNGTYLIWGAQEAASSTQQIEIRDGITSDGHPSPGLLVPMNSIYVTSGSSPEVAFKIPIWSDSWRSMKFMVDANEGHAGTNYGSFQITAMVRAGYDGSVVVRASDATVYGRSNAGITVTVSANTSSNTLDITVTGLNAVTLAWRISQFL